MATDASEADDFASLPRAGRTGARRMARDLSRLLIGAWTTAIQNFASVAWGRPLPLGSVVPLRVRNGQPRSASRPDL